MKLKTPQTILLLLALLAGGCSQTDEPRLPAMEPEQTEDAAEVELQFLVPPSKLNSPSGTAADIRPELHQHIRHMEVHIFDQAGSHLTSEYINWPATDSPGTLSVVHKLKTRLRAGEVYSFMAVGRDDDAYHHFNVSPAHLSEMKAVLSGSQQDLKQSEIFSGTATRLLSSSGNRVEVVLTRRMAALEAYFKNVPADTKLWIETAHNLNTAVRLRRNEGADFGEAPGQSRWVFDLIPNSDGFAEAFAFILPFEPKGSDTFTITIETGGSVTDIRAAKLANGSKSFSVDANCIYRIGSPTDPIDLPSGSDIWIANWKFADKIFIDSTDFH